ncbi:unnamed protein product [Nezara viridula]|nr:unnamed protein product [Nezara viridula]
MEEESLKESVYKLNQLKKKKKTVGRLIQKFDNDTKILKILKTSPNNFVNYGSKPSDWERKILIYLSELPPELEFETIFSRMEELVKSSQFPALPSWDRTETLTEMENVLMSKLNLLNNKNLMSNEINKELKSLVDSLVEIIEQEGKVRDLNKLLPSDIGDCCSSDLSDSSSSDLPLPGRPPTKKLVDSVLREIQCFLELNLRQNLPDHIIDYVKPCISGYYQLLQLNNEMKMHSKLMNLDEKIRGLNLTVGDVASDYVDLPDKINELNISLSENMMLVKNETELLDEVYRRVKAGFNFLRKEPLNESLTGLLISDKDVSYWLKRGHLLRLFLLDQMSCCSRRIKGRRDRSTPRSVVFGNSNRIIEAMSLLSSSRVTVVYEREHRSTSGS